MERCLMSAYYTHVTYWDPMLLFSGVKRETHMQILHMTPTSYKEQKPDGSDTKILVGVSVAEICW